MSKGGTYPVAATFTSPQRCSVDAATVPADRSHTSGSATQKTVPLPHRRSCHAGRRPEVGSVEAIVTDKSNTETSASGTIRGTTR